MPGKVGLDFGAELLLLATLLSHHMSRRRRIYNGRRAVRRRTRRTRQSRRLRPRRAKVLLRFLLNGVPVDLTQRVLGDGELAPVRRDVHFELLVPSADRLSQGSPPAARARLDRCHGRMHLLQEQAGIDSSQTLFAMLRSDRVTRDFGRARAGTGSDAEEESKVGVEERGLELARLGVRGESDRARVADEGSRRDKAGVGETSVGFGTPDGRAVRGSGMSAPAKLSSELAARAAHLTAFSRICSPVASLSAIT